MFRGHNNSNITATQLHHLQKNSSSWRMDIRLVLKTDGLLYSKQNAQCVNSEGITCSATFCFRAFAYWSPAWDASILVSPPVILTNLNSFIHKTMQVKPDASAQIYTAMLVCKRDQNQTNRNSYLATIFSRAHNVFLTVKWFIIYMSVYISQFL